MSDLADKVVLVTGAASGIGKEAAAAFAKRGSRMVLVDIDTRPLEQLAVALRYEGAECEAYTVDVSDPDRVLEMARDVVSRLGFVDVLVNAAGVFLWADIVDTTHDDWRWIIGANLWGVVNTIHAFLPAMTERKSGHIVNVASGGGLVAMTSIGAYSSTKFAVVGLGEALRQEVREHGVGVSTVCPGSTRTPIIYHIRVRGYDAEKLRKYFFRLFNRQGPEKTARVIVRAVERNRPLVVTTLTSRILFVVKRISPRLLRVLLRPVRCLYNRMR